MDPHYWLHLCGYAWTVFLVYWFVSALRLKAVKQRETPGERLTHVVPMLVSYALLFRNDLGIGWLATRFVPDTPQVGKVAVVLAVVGIAFAIWARWHLGANWSGSVTLKENHELIRSGPYRNIRHPIYTGMLVALVGTMLARGEVRGILAVILCWGAFYFKARREETILRQEFGERFQEHTRHTGMFLPHFG